MNWKKVLTPINTEEIRPGLFIQSKPKNPDSIEYRVINPVCWDGNYRWKKQFSWKNLITIIIICLLAWSYLTETQYSRQLQEDPCELLPNITSYCWEKNKISGDDYAEENYTVIISDYP